MYRLIQTLIFFLAVLATSATAQQVRLVSPQTGLTLTGEILLFDGVSYRLNTSIGQILLRANQVECIGDACPSDATTDSSSFGVFGSNTIGASLMPSLIEAWSSEQNLTLEHRPGGSAEQATMAVYNQGEGELTEIALQSAGSSTSFPALISGDAQIGMSSRKVKDEEVAKLVEAGFEPIDEAGREHVLALDGLVVIVSPDNPLSAISMEDLGQVFAGEITNWAELGGPDAPINVYARDTHSGTWDTFKSLVLNPAGADLTSGAVRYTSNADLADAVAADPASIGFTGFAYQRGARALSLRTGCGLEISPSLFGVQTEEYPLSRRLYLYTTGAKLPPNAANILGYATSDEAQSIINQAGFVDQAVGIGGIETEHARLRRAAADANDAVSTMLARNIVGELKDAVRLSTTFRFTEDGDELDVKSRSDATRLARFIRDIMSPQEELVLVGYEVDSEADSFDVSLKNAELVADAIRGDLGLVGGPKDTSLLPLAYGGMAPVACNDTAKGRSTNRRVEVWLRSKS